MSKHLLVRCAHWCISSVSVCVLHCPGTQQEPGVLLLKELCVCGPPDNSSSGRDAEAAEAADRRKRRITRHIRTFVLAKRLRSPLSAPITAA
uniref:Secreted protein n=1 Tax=Knipowitschia caucasica TaxID=637954 RepID=A0AAV2KSM3_KNICA